MNNKKIIEKIDQLEQEQLINLKEQEEIEKELDEQERVVRQIEGEIFEEKHFNEVSHQIFKLLGSIFKGNGYSKLFEDRFINKEPIFLKQLNFDELIQANNILTNSLIKLSESPIGHIIDMDKFIFWMEKNTIGSIIDMKKIKFDINTININMEDFIIKMIAYKILDSSIRYNIIKKI